MYVGALRLALDQHQRPTAMLLRDPYALHRNYFTGDPDGEHDEWTTWDFSLATAVQDIQDGTTEEGHLIWEIEADDVDVIAVHQVNKAREAIELVTGGEKYKAVPGEYYRTRLHHPYHDPESGEEERWQSRREWIEKMVAEESAQ